MKPPRIWQGELSGRWFLSTDYHELPEDQRGSSFEIPIVADSKIDITDAVAAVGLRHVADMNSQIDHAKDEAELAWREVARLREELGLPTEPPDA